MIRVRVSVATCAAVIGLLSMTAAAPVAAQPQSDRGVLRNAVANLAAMPDVDRFLDVSRAAAPQSTTAAAGRMRITSGISVEQALLLITASPSVGDSVVSRDGMTHTVAVRDGHSYTLLRDGARVVGDVAAAGDSALILKMEDGRSVTVPRSGIVRYERPNGVPSRKRRALLGLLFGGTGGALIGYAHGQGCVPSSGSGFPDFSCMGQPAGSTLGGLLIGGGIGATVGALLPRHERWLAVRP